MRGVVVVVAYIHHTRERARARKAAGPTGVRPPRRPRPRPRASRAASPRGRRRICRPPPAVPWPSAAQGVAGLVPPLVITRAAPSYRPSLAAMPLPLAISTESGAAWASDPKPKGGGRGGVKGRRPWGKWRGGVQRIRFHPWRGRARGPAFGFAPSSSVTKRDRRSVGCVSGGPAGGLILLPFPRWPAAAAPFGRGGGGQATESRRGHAAIEGSKAYRRRTRRVDPSEVEGG